MGDLSRNFSSWEFACRCKRHQCDAPPPSPKLIEKLQLLRDRAGQPLYVSSGSRCEYWNNLCGGADKSRHLKGEAADVSTFNGFVQYHLVAAAIDLGFKGIGVGRSFVHVDVRKGKETMWTYGNA